MPRFLKNKIYAGLDEKKLSVAQLSEEIFCTPRTLFRRMANPDTLRLGELYAIGEALGWSPAEFGRVLAREFEQDMRRKNADV